MWEEDSEDGQEIEEGSLAIKDSPTELPANTYQMRPQLHDKFTTTIVKEIIQVVLTETLTGKSYSPIEATKWTKIIADEINLRIKELSMRRYKHVVEVKLGQQTGAGSRYIARCRWDAECDNQISEIFTNATIFCIVTVFGVYHY